MNVAKWGRAFMLVGIFCIAACSSKLDAVKVKDLLVKMDQAIESKDADRMGKLLASNLAVEIDMSIMGIPKPLQLNRSQYLELMRMNLEQSGDSYRYVRTGGDVMEFMGEGRFAQTEFVIEELADVLGEKMQSTTETKISIQMIKGEPLIIKMKSVVVSIK